MNRDLTERVEQGLIGSKAISGLAGAVQKLMTALLRNPAIRPFKTFLSGRWLEHPLHPVLTTVSGLLLVAMEPNLKDRSE